MSPSPRSSALALVLLISAAGAAMAATTCNPPDPTVAAPQVIAAVATHQAESRVDAAQLLELTVSRDSAIAAGLAWERRSHVAERQRDVARAASDSLAERAAMAPTAADSATLYAGAYNACRISLDAATLSCAQKDSALLEERSARADAERIAAVNLRGQLRADSVLAIAVSNPRVVQERCRVAGLIPCPSRTVVLVGTAIAVHGVTAGWLRPPDLQLRW
ncbi:MAG: hypothetical protein H0X64_10680 [Gemmatimonadaceae bacterium]|nr:hypothetical protein [Gemmatimonadaceae bacterium]